MNRFTRSLLNGATRCGLALHLSLIVVLFGAITLAKAQETKKWSERETMGFRGAVRTALTTVTRLNPDPRPEQQRKLFPQGMPDWAVFDSQGRRTEFASTCSGSGIEAISSCTFNDNGVKNCIDSTGRRQQSREQETTLADGSREVTHFLGSKIQSREVTLLDEKGRTVGSRNYDSTGRLTSEGSTLSNGDDETKIYDSSGHEVFDEQTRTSDDKTRFDRWSYDSDGHLVWHLALNSDGEVLSNWYQIGYKPKLSSSGDLGICLPRLCVEYKFDEQGSGRMEKTVQHTPGEGNREPDSEEHYNLDGILDERIEIKYARDGHGNWTSRSVFVWDATSNQMIEIERDVRTIEYY